MNYAIILSGGIGTRMQMGDFPKQYLEVEKKPILLYTLEQFQKSSAVEKIVIVAADAWREKIRGWMEEDGITKFLAFADAGDTRQESIHNGLTVCMEDSVSENDGVIIHDGVRPLVSEQLIGDCLAALADHEGCTTDVAHQDFRNKDRYGDNVKHTTKRNRHRRNQEGCRDGVNHSRTHCGDEREQDEQLSWRPFGHFHRPQSQQTEETGFLDDGNQDHHAAQKTDCIEVNELFDGFILRNIAAVEHRTAAEHGADRTRNLF